LRFLVHYTSAKLSLLPIILSAFPTDHAPCTMHHALTTKMHLKQHIAATFTIALPVIIGQLGSLLMNVTDNIMVGHLGELTLSSASLGNSCYILLAILGIGATNSIPSLVAQARGAQDEMGLDKLMHQTVWYAIFNGVLTCVLVALGSMLIPYLGQPPAEVRLAQIFMLLLAFSTIFNNYFLCLKGYFDGMEHTKIGMYISVCGIFVNILLNYVLVFGAFGLPALGLPGSAIATIIARFLQALAITIVLKKHSITSLILDKSGLAKPDWGLIGKMARLGFPMGLQYFFELAAFSGGVIMLGWLPDTSIIRSSHQITINAAALTFMVAMGIGVAGSVRVGEAFGRGSKEDMKAAGRAALLLGIVIMLCLAVVLLIFRHKLAILYGFDPIKDAKLFEITAQLVIITAIFQLFDGAQAICAGLLRGLQDVKIPTWITVFSYVGVWAPLAWVLAMTMGYGVYGIWWAYVIALATAAILLTARFFRLVRGV
jgi:multidrug resistance protein, MATE family